MSSKKQRLTTTQREAREGLACLERAYAKYEKEPAGHRSAYALGAAWSILHRMAGYSYSEHKAPWTIELESRMQIRVNEDTV